VLAVACRAGERIVGPPGAVNRPRHRKWETYFSTAAQHSVTGPRVFQTEVDTTHHATTE